MVSIYIVTSNMASKRTWGAYTLEPVTRSDTPQEIYNGVCRKMEGNTLASLDEGLFNTLVTDAIAKHLRLQAIHSNLDWRNVGILHDAPNLWYQQRSVATIYSERCRMVDGDRPFIGSSKDIDWTGEWTPVFIPRIMLKSWVKWFSYAQRWNG